MNEKFETEFKQFFEPLDLVVLWDTMINNYNILKLSDYLTDDQKIELFNWVIQQINKYTSTCWTRLKRLPPEDMLVELKKQKSTRMIGQKQVKDIKGLMYYKYRTQWLTAITNYLEDALNPTEPEEEYGSWLDKDWSEQ